MSDADEIPKPSHENAVAKITPHGGGDSVLTFKGPVTSEEQCQQFGELMYAFADAEKPRGEKRRLIIDIGDTYIGSDAFRKFLNVQRKLNAQQDTLTIVNVNRDLNALFEITRLNTAFGDKGYMPNWTVQDAFNDSPQTQRNNK